MIVNYLAILFAGLQGAVHENPADQFDRMRATP